MKKIDIKIPDNISPQEEIKFIAKKLSQKALSGTGRNEQQKRIGQEVNVIDLHTQINITRFSNEPIATMVTCNVCGCEYQNTTASYYWHNYGGKPKQVAVCSSECQKAAIEFLGDRAAITKNKLKTIRLYR